MAEAAHLEQFLRDNGISFLRNEPLAQHTTFRIGGPADLFCSPATEDQLAKLLEMCRSLGVRCYLLGKGSNTLFSDHGFRGAIISTMEMAAQLTVEGERITAAAGLPLVQICRAALEHGLSGLEFAYGIPGSLGGAVYMNAGAYGGEMKDVLESVTFLDEALQVQTLPADRLQLGYRTSIFEKRPLYILSAVLKLEKGDAVAIQARMKELMTRRAEKQPLEFPSAGSTFKRPEGAFAGALIDQCGLRGFRVGGAAISEKHCGFVVNLGGATCADVVQLTEKVRQIVKEKTGYTLEREIRVVE